MQFPPFRLERWLARHEADAEITLAESGIRALSADRFDWDSGRLDYVVPTNGDPALRGAIADRYGRSADEALLTVGTQEANFVSILACMGAGDHAVVVTPAYQSLVSLPATLGEVTRVELSPPNWSLDVDRVAAALRPDTRLVILANPNNPVGHVHPEPTMAALADMAADVGATLLCDEVYRGLVADPPPRAAAVADDAISTAGLSKAHGMAGARIGWAVGPADRIEAAWGVTDYTTISPAGPSQTAAAAVLTDPDREAAILRDNRALAARNRERIADWIETHELQWCRPATVIAMVGVPSDWADGRAFCAAALEATDVLLVPGDVFGHPDFIRIGFGTDPDRLDRGLDRLSTLIEAGTGRQGRR